MVSAPLAPRDLEPPRKHQELHPELIAGVMRLGVSGGGNRISPVRCPRHDTGGMPDGESGDTRLPLARPAATSLAGGYGYRQQPRELGGVGSAPISASAAMCLGPAPLSTSRSRLFLGCFYYGNPLRSLNSGYAILGPDWYPPPYAPGEAAPSGGSSAHHHADSPWLPAFRLRQLQQRRRNRANGRDTDHPTPVPTGIADRRPTDVPAGEVPTEAFRPKRRLRFRPKVPTDPTGRRTPPETTPAWNIQRQNGEGHSTHRSSLVELMLDIAGG